VEGIRGVVMASQIPPDGVAYGENTDFIDCTFDKFYPFLLSVGSHSTLSVVRFLTHDSATSKITGVSTNGKIEIGDWVAVGANTLIMYDVVIGSDCVIRAGSVVIPGARIPDGEVWGGNPAAFICNIESFVKGRLAKPFFEKTTKDVAMSAVGSWNYDTGAKRNYEERFAVDAGRVRKNE